jgi:peptidoglycan/LPS O-acetylase OafA/YrhL
MKVNLLLSGRVRKASIRAYRADIDGLRALAVTGVLLYHMQSLEFFSGGFFGVDVFFVISGFLIARLIVEDLSRGTFSFVGFYSRRIRRLLPAFLTVVAVSAAISCFVLEPAKMLDFSKSMFFALFGVSNIYFMFQDSYWADDSETLPLLHTWSLGIEEQFYLIFPITLVIAAKFLSQMRVVALFSVFAFLSAGLAYWMLTVNTTYAFYLLPTRAWELLVGVILALVLNYRTLALPKIAASIIVGGGLFFIVISYVFFGPFVENAPILAIVPVIGATLVILGGGTQNPVSRLLGARPLVGLGLISYSLYLWHYPLLAFPRVFFGTSGFGQELIFVAISLTLASLTYFFIEAPFRRRQGAFVSVFISAGVLAVIAFVYGSISSNGLEARLSSIPDVKKPRHEMEYFQLDKVKSSSGTILLVGDSHMEGLVSAISRRAAELDFNFGQATKSGCQFLTGLERASKATGSAAECGTSIQTERLDWAASHPKSYVVLGGRLPMVLDSERFNNEEGGDEGEFEEYLREPGTTSFDLQTNRNQIENSYRETVRALLDAGHVVVLVYPIPEVGWDVPDEIFRRAASQNFSWPLSEPVTTSYERFSQRTRSSFELLDSIYGDDIIRIHPHTIFCEETAGGRCVTHDNNAIFYFDSNHLSQEGAELVARLIMTGIVQHSSRND